MPGNRASGFLVREDCRRDGWGGCWLGIGGNDAGSDGGGSAEGGGIHWAACGALISSSSSWDGAAVEVIPLAPRLAAQSASLLPIMPAWPGIYTQSRVTVVAC